MPKWSKFCKDGEKPSNFYGHSKFEKEFGIKTAFGPPIVCKDGSFKPKWNRCWSSVPEEWVPAIHELLQSIRAKYKVEGLEDNENDPDIDVHIDQIKDKFGSLRFYFTAKTKEMYDDIEKMVEECEKRLAKDDPYYGVPY